MRIPDASKPLDLLNDFLIGSDHYQIEAIGSTEAADFRQIRSPYFIDGDAPPFSIRPAMDHEMRTLSGEQHTFVEDWFHIPTNRLMHIAYQRRDFGSSAEWDEPVVFFGTQQHFVFALERSTDSDSTLAVIPAPKEQWNSVTERTGTWWGDALYNDEYTDFFMYGLYQLPLHYRALSRNDYESTKQQSAAEIIAELTGLGYQYVGNIVWSDDGMVQSFNPATPEKRG